jgi:hypothetical protein
MPRSRGRDVRVLRLVAVLALAVSAGGCRGPDETVGRVIDVNHKSVLVGSTEARDGDAFPGKTRLVTDRSGSVLFELDSGTHCRTRPNSELGIEPGRRISIHFRAGTSICSKDPNAEPHKYLAGKTLVTAEDPVFGVTVEGGESVVQVTFGFVEVQTTAAPEPVVVGPDQQAVVSPEHPAPRLEEIKLGPADKRITNALEERLPKEKAEPPGNLDEIVLGMAPSTPDSVKSFVRRLLATTWDVDLRLELLLEQKLETSLRKGTVDIVVAPKSAAPTDEALPLFTRQGTTWALAISPDSSFEQALRKLVTVSLQTGAYGDLYTETFASQPTYARAGRNGMTVIASEAENAAPTITITRNPPSTTTRTAATFHFEASESNVLFSCQLDAADPEPCESPQTYATIAPGEHTFTVRTTDAAGNAGRPATYRWIVKASGGGDTTEPTTKITSGPDGETTNTDATFAFEASEQAVAYGCSLDGMPFQPCESPTKYEDLVAGDHVFAVRAVDADDNVGRAEKRGWTIIEDPGAAGPTTRIVAKPKGRTARTTAAFRFSSETGTRFSCALDGTSFQLCKSPKVYRKLSPGRHTFAVRARIPNGKPGPQAEYSWSIVGSVDREPPVTTIISAPPTRTSERDATFSFLASEPNVRFGCSIDGSDFEPCSSPWPYNGLEVNAEHTFAVRGTDAAGNTGEPVRYTWEIAETEEESGSASRGTKATTQMRSQGTFGSATLARSALNQVTKWVSQAAATTAAATA